MTKTPDSDQQTPLAQRVSGGSRGLAARAVSLGIVGACVLVLAVFLRDERAADRAMPGVRVEQLDVSRLGREEMAARIRASWQARASHAIAFSLAGTQLVLQPENVGLFVDAETSANSALRVGRWGGYVGRLCGYVGRWFRPQTVPVSLYFDPVRLDRLLDDWEERAIHDLPFSGGIVIEGTNVSPRYPHPGTRLDRRRVAEQFKMAIRNESARELRDGAAAPLAFEPLATRNEAPRIDRAEVDRVVSQAQAMLTSGVTLANADQNERLSLTAAQVASLLEVRADTAHEKLELRCALDRTQKLLESQRGALERSPENARFVIDGQERVHVEPSHGALLLDDAAVANALCAAAQSSTRSAELPMRAGPEPSLTTEAAQHLGIVGLMGAYTTRHACCQPRVQNIHHIADLLDGTVVEPGQTFSVNQAVGQRSVKNGFRLAPSIEDGDMVDTVGGGVSQFATTLFNALFYGGYDILERQPHSYWFTRYPMGYDATLSYPHPDIVFKNDTEAGALIKASYTGTTITVKIYGDNGGRKVRAEVSARQNVVLPPVEFIPNPNLDADEEKTREGGMIGWSVIVKRTLTFPDGKIKEERRKVTYKPRARRVEVHPCKIPEGQPGHTGERCPLPDPDQAEGSESADAGAK